MYWPCELFQKVSTCTCQSWITINNEVGCPFITVCMLQMCSKIIVSLQLIKLFAGKITIVWRWLPLAAIDQQTFRHLRQVCSKSSIWNMKNIDKIICSHLCLIYLAYTYLFTENKDWLVEKYWFYAEYVLPLCWR